MEMQQMMQGLRATQEKAANANAKQEVLLARMEAKITPVGKPTMMH
jgi:hypothetical protein